MLTREDATSRGIPPALRDRYVVRVLEHKFGPNSKGNPMITVMFELVGKPNNTGSVDTAITRNGKSYEIAGLRTQPKWFVMQKGQSLDAYIQFYEAANGKGSFEGVNPENPDRAYMDNLALEATCYTKEDVQRRELTDEERAAKLKKNEPAIGEPIKDGEGRDLKQQQIVIGDFLQRFTGDLPDRPF
jgi:hypothetical protein